MDEKVHRMNKRPLSHFVQLLTNAPELILTRNSLVIRELESLLNSPKGKSSWTLISKQMTLYLGPFTLFAK